MARISAVKTGSIVIALVLVILILIFGGLVWFDYLGLINVKELLSPVTTRLGFDSPKPVENVDDMYLLERERMAKQQEALDLRSSELDLREEEIAAREAELRQMLDSMKEREEAFEEQEKSFNDRLKEYDNKNANLKQAAEYFVGMPPDAAVKMFLEMEDQDVIDILRAHQQLSDEAGTPSMVSYWLSLMPSDRAAALNRKMLKKPVS